jgi:hypothetical protein
MKYRYSFSINLFDQEKILGFKEGLKTIDKDFLLKDHGIYGFRFSNTNIWDSRVYNKLISLVKKCNVNVLSGDQKEHYTKHIDLDYDNQDKLSAAFLEISTKTEYDSEEYLNEFKNGDLFLEKKSLGNFKNFQLNFLDTEDCLVLLAKKRFCSFIEENKISNVKFKPVMVKSVTGNITPSKTVFWSIPDQVFKEGRETFRDFVHDKYQQLIPKSISPTFCNEIKDLDLFFAEDYSCFISQSLYRLIQEAELTDDISGASPWDVGYFGGEASGELKQKLIEQGTYDENFNEENGSFFVPQVPALVSENNKYELLRKSNFNYFQADLDYLGWNPVADTKCDITGEEDTCLQVPFESYDEAYALELSLEELKSRVVKNHLGDDFFYASLKSISDRQLKIWHEIDEDFCDDLSDEVLDKLSCTPPYDGEGPWFMLDGDILPFIGIWYSDDVEEYFETKEEQEVFVRNINGQYQEEPLTLDTMNLQGRTIVFQNPKDQSLFAVYQYQ